MDLSAQNILLDEEYTDWTSEMLIYQDTEGDGQPNGIDIKNVWMSNDQSYIYLRFEVGNEINIQENNELTLYIDTDSDLNTGRKKNGIGVEFEWIFGSRYGFIYEADGDRILVGHEDIDLMSSPTVSSNQFEVGFRKSISELGINIEFDGNIQVRLEDNGFNGDDAPNEIGGINYTTTESNFSNFNDYSLDRSPETLFRLMTYNIFDDNLFDPSRSNFFKRQIQAINPDIIALQEVRAYNSSQTSEIIENYLPGTWYHEKLGFGIVLLSRYPILQKEYLGGNAAFLLSVDGKEILVINIHLPCCENDAGRQEEADEIMAYIRDLKQNNNDIKVSHGTPIIITGDSNLVGMARQQETLYTGDILDNSSFGMDSNPDWDGSNMEDAKPIATGTPYTKTWYNPFGSYSSGRLDYILYTGSAIELTNTFALSTRDMSEEFLQSYNLMSGDSEGASDHLPTVADFKLNTTSTKNTVAEHIHLYPNPSSDMIHISAKLNEIRSIDIFNSKGSKILSSDQNSVNIEHLTNGIYYVKINTTKGFHGLTFSKI